MHRASSVITSIARPGGRQVALAVLLFACSCDAGSPSPATPAPAPAPQPPPPAPPPAAPTPVAEEPAEPPPPPAPPPAVTVAEARTLADAWLAAQNGKDFAAYAALYADDFSGVQRTGGATRTMNRRDWLAARKKMFARPMTVEIADLAVTTGPDQTELLFEQRFATKGYRDAGPKRIVVRPVAGAVRIVAEEMLASNVAEGALPAGKGDLTAADLPAALIAAAGADVHGRELGTLTLRWGRRIALAGGGRGAALVFVTELEDVAGPLVFVLAAEKAGTLTLVGRDIGSYGIDRLGLLALPDADVDGDGVADHFLLTDTSGGDGEWKEMAAFVTATPGVGEFPHSMWWGEGSATEIATRYVCVARIDGATAWVRLIHREDWESVDAAPKVGDGAAIAVQRGGTFAPAEKLWAVQRGEGKRAADLVEAWRAAIGDPAAAPEMPKIPGHIAACPAALIVGHGSVKGRGGAWRLIEGLSLTRDAAVAKAGGDAARVVELRPLPSPW